MGGGAGEVRKWEASVLLIRLSPPFCLTNSRKQSAAASNSSALQNFLGTAALLLCLTRHLSSPAGQPAPKFRRFNTIGRTFHNTGISRHWKSRGPSRPQLLAGGCLGRLFTLRACLTSTVVLLALRPCDTRISDWTVSLPVDWGNCIFMRSIGQKHFLLAKNSFRGDFSQV